MSESRRITCKTHGPSQATFACEHIATATEGCGFCVSADETSDPWPDATCNACTRALENGGDESVEPRLLCKYCWEDAFAACSNVPEHRDQRGFVQRARERAAKRQDVWMERHGIGKHKHWQMDLDGEAPWLGFGDSATRIYRRADAFVIGSWSKRGETWLWGWGNDNWDPKLTSPFVAVKRYGEEHGLDLLWRMGGPATEDDGFALAAVALDLVPGFEGIYRAPADNVSLFLALRNTQLVS